MIMISSLCVLAALTFPELEPLDPALDWHDCSAPDALEGRGFPGEGNPFHRIPERFHSNTTDKVWRLSQTSIGFNARFVTDSDMLSIRWDFPGYHGPMPQESMLSHAGIDVYARGPGEDKWRHVGFAVPSWRVVKEDKKGTHTFAGEMNVKWRPGDEALVYLPARVGPKNFAIGLKKGATYKKGRPHIVDKPVVMYGTSIVNGGQCSRPGMLETSIIGRLADVEVKNFGFSGSGCMEPPMADIFAAIDASLYVIDCEHNMNYKLVDENYEKFIRRLQSQRPDVPVLMIGGSNNTEEPSGTEKRALAILERLKKEEPEKFGKFYHLSGVPLLPKTDDCRVDFVHPNDHGFMTMSPVVAAKIREILGK